MNRAFMKLSITGYLLGAAITIFLLFGLWCCEKRRSRPEPAIEVARYNLSGGVEASHAGNVEDGLVPCKVLSTVKLAARGSSAPPAQSFSNWTHLPSVEVQP